MNKEQDKKYTSGTDKQQGGEHKNLDDIFNNDKTKEREPSPEEEAEAEQKRKEALTERD